MPRGIIGIKKFEEKIRNPTSPEWDTMTILEDLARRLARNVKLNQERLEVVEKYIQEKKDKSHPPGSR